LKDQGVEFAGVPTGIFEPFASLRWTFQSFPLSWLRQVFN